MRFFCLAVICCWRGDRLSTECNPSQRHAGIVVESARKPREVPADPCEKGHRVAGTHQSLLCRHDAVGSHATRMPSCITRGNLTSAPVRLHLTRRAIRKVCPACDHYLIPTLMTIPRVIVASSRRLVAQILRLLHHAKTQPAGIQTTSSSITRSRRTTQG